MKRVLEDIQKIESKIEIAEIERNEAKEKLEAAILEKKPKAILTSLRALLDSATQELHDSRQKELRILDERRDLENRAVPPPAPAPAPALHQHLHQHQHAPETPPVNISGVVSFTQF